MDIWDKIEAGIDKRINDTDTTSSKNIVNTSKTKFKEEIIIHITRDGTYINNTLALPQEVIKKIKNYFTLSDKNIMGHFVHTSLWSYRKSILYIPRFGSQLLKQKFENITYVNEIEPINPLSHISYSGIFKGNQKIIFDEIINKWFNIDKMRLGKSGLVLNLDAGHGKSFLAMALIGHFKCRTLVVTHNTTKLNEWVGILTEHCPGSKIGQYYGKKKLYGDVVVGIINSLVSDVIKLPTLSGDPREFYDKFDLIILDECHEFVSAARRKIYDICQTPYIIGLSATPADRVSDSLDKVSNWCCGPILMADKIKDYTLDNIPFKGRVTCVKYSGHENFTKHLVNEKLDLVSVPLMIGQICEDPYRLKMIVSLILEQRSNGLNVLVFADRRSYLETIRLLLGADGDEACILDDNVKSIRLVGGSSAEDMQIAINSKNIILSTYQYFGTGVSIPKLNSVILTTPRKSKSKQFINRIFRLGANYEIERQIVDIVDVKISIKNQWYERKKYYDEKGYEIDTRKVKWQDFKK